MHTDNKTIKPSREMYWDILRIIALLAAVFIHVSVYNYKTIDQDGANWMVCNMFNGISRFCIPLLFMISGAFLLDGNREYSLKKLYGQKIMRLVVAYCVWSAIYSLVFNFIKFGTVNKSYIMSAVRDFMLGHYHLWFIFAMIAVYAIVPFLRLIAKDKKLTEYFLVLWLIFSVITNVVLWLPVFTDEFKAILADIDMNFVVGYSGYFLLGFYLRKNEIKKSIRVLIYISALIVLVLSVIANRRYAGTSVDLYSYFAPNALLVSTAVLLFVKNAVGKLTIGEKIAKVISGMAQLTFGVFLVHIFIITFVMEVVGLSTLSIPIVTVPLISLLVFIISLGCSFVIRKIPGIGKIIC